MGHSHTETQVIQNPGKLNVSMAMTGIFSVLALLGMGTFITTVGSDPVRAWTSFLRGHFFFMQVSVAALFFVAITWITISMWSAPFRRIAESFTAYLPVALLSTIILIFGMKYLYPWVDPAHVHGDYVLESKQGYLNVPFFIIRNVGAVLIWMFFARKLVGSSLATDFGADYKSVWASNKKFSIAFIMFYAISFSLSSFDQLMSLDPHWFSTMFGVYLFAGSYQTFFAGLIIMLVLLKRAGYLEKIINENHYHDVAKFMFAFTIFWAYTGFSQYMLIWYANLPEETGYFLRRFNGGWENVSLGLFIAKFVLPFLILLPRGNKRHEGVIFLTAIWILGTQYYDLNWLIQPEFRPEGFSIGFVEIAIFLGFFGLFGLMVTQFLKRHNIVAVRDAYLPEAVFHHHVNLP